MTKISNVTWIDIDIFRKLCYNIIAQLSKAVIIFYFYTTSTKYLLYFAEWSIL